MDLSTGKMDLLPGRIRKMTTTLKKRKQRTGNKNGNMMKNKLLLLPSKRGLLMRKKSRTWSRSFQSQSVSGLSGGWRWGRGGRRSRDKPTGGWRCLTLTWWWRRWWSSPWWWLKILMMTIIVMAFVWARIYIIILLGLLGSQKMWKGFFKVIFTIQLHNC